MKIARIQPDQSWSTLVAVAIAIAINRACLSSVYLINNILHTNLHSAENHVWLLEFVHSGKVVSGAMFRYETCTAHRRISVCNFC